LYHDPSLLSYLALAYRWFQVDITPMADSTPDDRDTRIEFSIGTKYSGPLDGIFEKARGLAFDPYRGLLFVADRENKRVQLFATDNGGSFVSKFDSEVPVALPGKLKGPWGLAIDHERDRIFVTDIDQDRVLVCSLNDLSFLASFGSKGTGDLGFRNPRGIAIDRKHNRVIVADGSNNRLHFASAIDFSFLFTVGLARGGSPGEFRVVTGVAVDHDRDRVVVTDTNNNRVQVLSSVDGSFLFAFGNEGSCPGEFKLPQGVCVDDQGRIIVADINNRRLQAFTHEGHYISSFDCGEEPWHVAFDEHRGLIAYSASHQVHVIGANRWLPNTAFTWRPDRHRYAPERTKQAVVMVTMIRSVHYESTLSLLPNELLFEIFAFL